MKINWVLILVLIFGVVKLHAQQKELIISHAVMTEQIAEHLSVLPIKCLQKEFPNKLNQVLDNATELGTPIELHPAFYGCFDWHSSVHGHWMLVRLLRLYPNLKNKDIIRNILSENITSANILSELDYFNRKSERSFERTYGWAWLLKLDQELLLWNDPLAGQLHTYLQPLVELLSNRYLEFLPKLLYPIRTGEHPNTAFGLSLAYDYACMSGSESLKQAIEMRAHDYYINDVNCPLSWEPGGFDFLSPCFQEAELMSKILPHDQFRLWLDSFLPQLKDLNFNMEVANVSDRTDGKLVHLDGLNFCRAWSIYAITKAIPEYHHLNAIADKHIKVSLSSILDGSYEGEHWLASFAILSMSN